MLKFRRKKITDKIRVWKKGLWEILRSNASFSAAWAQELKKSHHLVLWSQVSNFCDFGWHDALSKCQLQTLYIAHWCQIQFLFEKSLLKNVNFIDKNQQKIDLKSLNFKFFWTQNEVLHQCVVLQNNFQEKSSKNPS